MKDKERKLTTRAGAPVPVFIAVLFNNSHDERGKYYE